MRWAGKVVKRPIVAFVVPVDRAGAAGHLRRRTCRDFDLLADLPKDNEARVGFDVLAAHFGAGEMQPLNVVVVDSDALRRPAGLARAEDLRGHAGGAPPRGARYAASPARCLSKKTLSVADQLDTVAQGVRDGIKAAAGDGAARRGRGRGRSAPGRIQAEPRRVDRRRAATWSSSRPPTPRCCRTAGYRPGDRCALESSRPLWRGQADPTPGCGRRTRRRGDAASCEASSRWSRSPGVSTRSGSRSRPSKPDAILLPDLYLQEQRGSQGAARRLLLRRRHGSPSAGGARLRTLQPGRYRRRRDIRPDVERTTGSREWSRATPPCSSTSATPPTGT